ncbi:HAT family dimerization domain containing protein [Trifolium pratense]|uniref:HAT family dimerization domain containing protein n=1 Tax=Trifolium pratense TaxID=57577 RepID=A0A2K3PQB7_TRIPR|nr:HAT family dimerization domain containing protein [Trifolium pratense]
MKETTKVIEEHKLVWKKTGCTIMSDGWTDKRRRTILNFSVNSPKGTVFLKSIDASYITKTADKIFEMIDEVVEQVGEENVVQIVTDNAANYKVAGAMLMYKRKKLYWTPCAAHCIDLMLEDLVRPAVTRFATSYLTLRCLAENKSALIRMFTSNEWTISKFAKTADGKLIEEVIMDKEFWKDVIICLKGAGPLIKVLRLVDSDEEPTMGLIYETMDQTKEKIQVNFNSVQKSSTSVLSHFYFITTYKPLWDIIDVRWDRQMHRPLHAAGYYLNPKLHYGADFKADYEVKRGFPIAMAALETNTAAQWWESYGDEHPELQKFAICVLSLTCSSSGCERNWSAFEMVHRKRRNRLKQKTMNDVVFVMTNSRLSKNNKTRKVVDCELEFDDIDSDNEWIVEDGGDNEILDFTIGEDLDGEAQNEEHEVAATAEDEFEIHNLDDEFEGDEDGMEDMGIGFDENVLKDLMN